MVYSDYLRTQQTLSDFTSFQDDIPIEAWKIHEFINIPVSAMNGTTLEERIPHIKAYWDRMDPTYCSDGSECFEDFVDRIDSFIENLQYHSAEKILVCSHFLFLTGVRWRLLHWPNDQSAKSKIAMQSYRDYLQQTPWKNAEIKPFNVTPTGMIRLRKSAKPPTMKFGL